MDDSVLLGGMDISLADQMTQQLAEQEKRLRELFVLQRHRLEELEGQLWVAQEAAQERQKSLEDQLAAMEAERDALQNQLAKVASRLQEGTPTQFQDAGAEELRRRYEMALEDIRHLQAENQQLRQQLASLASEPKTAAHEGLDNWEAFKSRILESLESEASEQIDEPRRQERVRIAEVLETTEAALVAKDRELESMRHLLENQTANLGTMAVGAAAVGELLNQDEIIREQQETLRRLEAEWREKLRQAEVELSLERAALARQRIELEQKFQEVEEQLQAQGSSAQTETTTKKSGGGWRTFFGLTDAQGNRGK